MAAISLNDASLRTATTRVVMTSRTVALMCSPPTALTSCSPVCRCYRIRCGRRVTAPPAPVLARVASGAEWVAKVVPPLAPGRDKAGLITHPVPQHEHGALADALCARSGESLAPGTGTCGGANAADR